MTRFGLERALVWLGMFAAGWSLGVAVIVGLVFVWSRFA